LRTTKTDRLRNLGGVAGHSPVLSGTVFVGLLSLIGLPPLTGFFGKFLAFDAAIRGIASNPGLPSALALVALLLGAILTILYATRVWVGGLGARDDSGRDRFRRVGSGRGSRRRTRGGHRSRRRGVRPGLPVRRDGRDRHSTSSRPTSTSWV